jgi:hypothetical protein
MHLHLHCIQLLPRLLRKQLMHSLDFDMFQLILTVQRNQVPLHP